MPHAQLRPHLSLVADPAELLRILPRYARGDDVNEPMFDLGIPYPIWPTKPSPAEASARTATRQGRQVHSIIARLAHLAPTPTTTSSSKRPSPPLSQAGRTATCPAPAPACPASFASTCACSSPTPRPSRARR